MDRSEKIKILVLLTLAFILTYAWTWVPASKVRYSYFPFSHQLLSRQAFYDYAFWRVTVLIFLSLMCFILPLIREYLTIFWFLWLGYLCDYLLCYNEPFAHFLGVPLSYSLFCGLTMIFIALYNILK
jgi:hypothetical protein